MTRVMKFTALVALLMTIPLVWKISHLSPARGHRRVLEPDDAADRRYDIDDWIT